MKARPSALAGALQGQEALISRLKDPKIFPLISLTFVIYVSSVKNKMPVSQRDYRHF